LLTNHHREGQRAVVKNLNNLWHLLQPQNDATFVVGRAQVLYVEGHQFGARRKSVEVNKYIASVGVEFI
jgi:hypothetical protein